MYLEPLKAQSCKRLIVSAGLNRQKVSGLHFKQCAKYEDVPFIPAPISPSYLLVTVKLVNSAEICMTRTPELHNVLTLANSSIPAVHFAYFCGEGMET